MALGVPDFDPRLTQQAMSFQRDLLGQLGANIQKNITTVLTKNDLAGFAQEVQNVDPSSPTFGRDLTGLLTRHPLAAQTPIAAAAINQLGAEFKFHQQQQLRQQDPWRYAGQGQLYNQTTGETKTVFETPVKTERPAIIRTPRGAVMADPRTGEEIATFGDPFAQAVPKPTAPSFINEVKYRKMKALSDELNSVRKELSAAGIDPEAGGDVIVAKLGGQSGERGALLNARRQAAQDALAAEAGDWRNAETFVQAFENRYLSPIAQTPVATAAAPAPSIPAIQSRMVVEPAMPEAEVDVLIPTESAPVNSGEIIAVKSVSEARSLPSGTKFRDPNGVVRIVP